MGNSATSNQYRSRSNSNASSSHRMSHRSSLSSFNSSFKQLGLPSSSSSSLASAAALAGLSSSLPSGSLVNSTWEVVAPPVKLNDIGARSLTTSQPNPFLDGTYKAVAAERRTSWTPSVLTLKEQSSLRKLGLDMDEEQEPEDHVSDLTRKNSMRSHDDDDTEIITVETFREKIPKRLDAQYLSSADLASLKESDPFMYYSIPAVKKAVWEGKEVDFDVEFDEPVNRSSAVSFESINGPCLGEGFYDTYVGNGEQEVDLFMSLFGVDSQ